MFKNIYKNKKIIITGHTGFKGSWLSLWLLKLGANVVGISKDIPTNPSLFESLELKNYIKDYLQDIRDLDGLKQIIEFEKPDFIFHLAAQAIVSTSYANPIETLTTNINGTMNILEILRGYKKKCITILITSDKCYDNVEWVWGYKETDQMGGKDIYSGSKGGAELVIKSYLHSFFQNDHPVKIGIGRAGNVIGGGDWAKDRIIVDTILAWKDNRKVNVRSPKATRPWQHVLEPLSGYLNLGLKLYNDANFHGQAYNFGPKSEQNRTVIQLLSDLGFYWGFSEENKGYEITDNIPFHEAGLLKLNCDKALFDLKWESNLIYKETIGFISRWYIEYYKNTKSMFQFTTQQIEEYELIAKDREKEWTK